MLARAARAAPPAAPCASDEDCELNGACGADGACVCYAGWTGADCGQLDLAPAPLTPAFFRNTVATWGGSPVLDAGGENWHMFFALMEGHCGLNAWIPNSAIYRAVSVSGSPIGPYVNETRVLPWFAHNPTASRQADGSLLIWHIGDGGSSGSFNANCTNGTTPPPPPPPPVRFQISGGGGGGCLVANGTWPCWTSPDPHQAWSACPLIVGDCASPTALWSVEGESFVSNLGPTLSVNVDCDHCSTGAGAKLFSAGASGLVYNASASRIQVAGCSSTNGCLSNGAPGAVAPCGGGTEPWSLNQIHVVPCDAPEAQGWKRVEGTPGAPPPLQSKAEAAGAAAGAWPLPPTDINAIVSVSGSVFGPFVETGVFQGPRAECFPWESDNPAPLVFPNGTTWVMYRSWNPSAGTNCTTPIGIARSDAPTWNATYTHGAHSVPSGFANATDQGYVPLEDPWMWLDPRGNFHALFHSMGGCKAVGCHAFSRDGYRWALAASDAYTTTVEFADGSSKQYARRERPHLVLNAAGDPAFLTNGVQESWDSDHSYTLVQQTTAAWP